MRRRKKKHLFQKNWEILRIQIAISMNPKAPRSNPNLCESLRRAGLRPEEHSHLLLPIIRLWLWLLIDQRLRSFRGPARFLTVGSPPEKQENASDQDCRRRGGDRQQLIALGGEVCRHGGPIGFSLEDRGDQIQRWDLGRPGQDIRRGKNGWRRSAMGFRSRDRRNLGWWNGRLRLDLQSRWERKRKWQGRWGFICPEKPNQTPTKPDWST